MLQLPFEFDHDFKTMQGSPCLFSPHEVPGLYEAFCGPADEFELLYEISKVDAVTVELFGYMI